MPVIHDEDIDHPDEIPFEVTHTYQDLVNRLFWNHCDVSPTGEYICASTYMNHDVYIWETTKGSLVKILEGPKEELGFVEWHPNRPMIAASGLETGRIYIWATVNPQKWSALAPDFRELEENVEYMEREDEFDYKDREVMTKMRLEGEDEKVDLVTIDDSEIVGGGEDGMQIGGWRDGGIGSSSGGGVGGTEGWTMPVLLDIEESSSDEEVKIVGPTAKKSLHKNKDKNKDKDENDENGAASSGGGGKKGRKRKVDAD